MELVVEIDGRPRARIERLTLGAGASTLGRAFSSDLLLQDKTVDASHARLYCTLDVQGQPQLQVEDLGSANGSRLNGEWLQPGNATALQSGDQLQLGKTRLRVYASDHPVGPAHSPTRMEQLRDTLGRGPILIAVTLLSLGLYLWLDYLHVGSDYKINVAISEVMNFVRQAGLWMLFWGTVSKLIRGEFSFWPHWCIGALLAALIPAADEVLSIVGFNWQSLQGYRLLDAIVSATIGVISVFIALSFATQLRLQARVGVALVPAILLLITGYALPLISDQRNVAAPQMLSLSRPPAFKLVGSAPASELLNDSAILFERAQEQAVKQLADEAKETPANRSQPTLPEPSPKTP